MVIIVPCFEFRIKEELKDDVELICFTGLFSTMSAMWTSISASSRSKIACKRQMERIYEHLHATNNLLTSMSKKKKIQPCLQEGLNPKYWYTRGTRNSSAQCLIPSAMEAPGQWWGRGTDLNLLSAMTAIEAPCCYMLRKKKINPSPMIYNDNK